MLEKQIISVSWRIFLKNSRQFNCSGQTRVSWTTITKLINTAVDHSTNNTVLRIKRMQILNGAIFINSTIISSCGLYAKMQMQGVCKLWLQHFNCIYINWSPPPQCSRHGYGLESMNNKLLRECILTFIILQTSPLRRIWWSGAVQWSQ